MKAFVTGGTGFIGRHVIQQLLQGGHTVHALVRSKQAAAALTGEGLVPFLGDITDRDSMRPGMQGCDVVFHIAAWYKLGGRDHAQAEEINVQGTRNVLGLAYELGIPRIVYTSTIAVLGDTHGVLADETYHMPAGQPFVTEYDRTKWLAHYQVALPLIEQGAPIMIVMPGAVFGPGDHSLVGALMSAYQRGLLPIFPGPDSMLTFAHVEDIARGHLLAAEKGRPGQSYILAGPALSFRQFIALCAQASGKALPWVYVPSRWIKPLLPLSQLLSRLPSWPEILSPDAIRVLDVTYIASAEKASRELGWQPRPLAERLRENFGWLSGHTPLLLSSRQKTITAAGLTGAALGILAARFLIPRLRSKGRK